MGLVVLVMPVPEKDLQTHLLYGQKAYSILLPLGWEKGRGDCEGEGTPISQSFKVQKEMSSKVPAMPPNPIVTSYSWVIYPKKSCGFTRPGLGGISGALYPNLPQILRH